MRKADGFVFQYNLLVHVAILVPYGLRFDAAMYQSTVKCVILQWGWLGIILRIIFYTERSGANGILFSST